MIAGCKADGNSIVLKTELLRLKIETDFKPLIAGDAYRFINDHYLPRLDSLPFKRRVYIRQLEGKDFAMLYKKESFVLQQKFAGRAPDNQISIPSSIRSNQFTSMPVWDARKLNKVSIITDADLADISDPKLSEKAKLKIWTKKLGKGYVSISYPQYNVNTKKLFIHELVEDGGWCGTGKERFLCFEKVKDGWRLTDNNLN
ncbi:hypothetical protein A0256_10840 [Mucilaginibacter sp. PAMC 26640]|nr:hypothetical protein A0256_10840 [Mucilaginibacter sp. PAMC 26640]